MSGVGVRGVGSREREVKGLFPFSLPHPRTPGTAFSQAKQYDFKTKTFAMIVKPINCNMVY